MENRLDIFLLWVARKISTLFSRLRTEREECFVTGTVPTAATLLTVPTVTSLTHTVGGPVNHGFLFDLAKVVLVQFD